MKKKSIALDKALSLDKETVAKLHEDQLGDVVGGGGTNTCNSPPPDEEALNAAFQLQAYCHACSNNG